MREPRNKIESSSFLDFSNQQLRFKIMNNKIWCRVYFSYKSLLLLVWTLKPISYLCCKNKSLTSIIFRLEMKVKFVQSAKSQPTIWLLRCGQAGRQEQEYDRAGHGYWIVETSELCGNYDKYGLLQGFVLTHTCNNIRLSNLCHKAAVKWDNCYN